VKKVFVSLLIAASFAACKKPYTEEQACKKIAALMVKKGMPAEWETAAQQGCLENAAAAKAELAPEQFRHKLDCVEKYDSLDAILGCMQPDSK